MRLGFAVKVLGAGGLPSHDTRRWQSDPHLSVSLDRLEAILGYLEDNAIGMYRMAAALAPYGPHPDLPRVRDPPRQWAQPPARPCRGSAPRRASAPRAARRSARAPGPRGSGSQRTPASTRC